MALLIMWTFPISRDPPEGGTIDSSAALMLWLPRCFQFLGIPPKGELDYILDTLRTRRCFQFLGIPPKGERVGLN